MSSTTTTAALTEHSLKRILSYELPTWAKGYLQKEPTQGRIPLANLPTPLHQVFPSKNSPKDSVMRKLAEKDISLYIKRDDMTGGVELGGTLLSLFLCKFS